jgi:DNA-binding MarR family transcriptional regulator
MEPRWLTAAEQRAWRTYLEATVLLFDALDRQLQAEAGMPHGYYEILVRLSEAPGRQLRMSELAGATRSSRSRLSHAAARLEERGWIRRTAALGDRRGQVASLSEAGFAALADAAPGHVATVRRYLIERLDADQIGQLEAIAHRVVAGLADESPRPGLPDPAEAAGPG